MEQILFLKKTNPDDNSIVSILNQLSQNLLERFGSDGKNSFTDWENNNSKYVFVIAELNSEIVGCGAIRPVSEYVGEVKRMYSKYQGKNIGKTILTFLEAAAIETGYSELILETRIKNEIACGFYQKAGYNIITNYGKYANNPEAICFKKTLIHN
jgi:ribosomal protein S18 acetylase RimI-like enzyme